MRKTAMLAFAAGVGAAHAAGFGSLGTLAQDEFRRLSEDVGAVISYKGVTPATPLGAAGFDIGVEVTDTKIENSSLFSRAGTGTSSHVAVPKLHVHKGLIGGLDFGGFVGGAPDVDATIFGAELRYAVLDDTLTTPALGVRLSGTRVSGTGDLRAAAGALDLMISKRFTALTPYGGAGTVRVVTKAGNTPLAEEKFNKSRLFAGVNANLVAVNFAVEVEKMGGNTSLSAKAGWRF